MTLKDKILEEIKKKYFFYGFYVGIAVFTVVGIVVGMVLL